MSLTTLADSIWEHIDNNDNTKHLPLRGIVQIVKLIIWLIALIIIPLMQEWIDAKVKQRNEGKLQIYCFTSTSAWVAYEAIQAAVFEHLAIMMRKFHLYVFENPSGRDTLIDGYMSPGKNPEFVAGLPYPFFRNSGTPMNPGNPPEGLYAQTPAAHPAKPAFGEPDHDKNKA